MHFCKISNYAFSLYVYLRCANTKAIGFVLCHSCHHKNHQILTSRYLRATRKHNESVKTAENLASECALNSLAQSISVTNSIYQYLLTTVATPMDLATAGHASAHVHDWHVYC